MQPQNFCTSDNLRHFGLFVNSFFELQSPNCLHELLNCFFKKLSTYCLSSVITSTKEAMYLWISAREISQKVMN